MLQNVKKFVMQEQGQGLTEYALILGLIALAAVVAVTAFGGKIKALFNTTSNSLGNVTSNIS